MTDKCFLWWASSEEPKQAIYSFHTHIRKPLAYEEMHYVEDTLVFQYLQHDACVRQWDMHGDTYRRQAFLKLTSLPKQEAAGVTGLDCLRDVWS